MKFFTTILLFVFCFTVSYSQKKYIEGFYIDGSGQKTECKIKYFRGSANLFRQSSCFIKVIDDNGEKVKLTPDDISIFKIDSDSFTIAKNFIYYPIVGNTDKDFVKVLQIGKINLYYHISTGTNGSGMAYDINTYVVSKNGRKFHGIHNKKAFKEVFIDLVKDDAAVMEFIEKMDKSRWEAYLPVIVTLYNNNASSL